MPYLVEDTQKVIQLYNTHWKALHTFVERMRFLLEEEMKEKVEGSKLDKGRLEQSNHKRLNKMSVYTSLVDIENALGVLEKHLRSKNKEK